MFNFTMHVVGRLIVFRVAQIRYVSLSLAPSLLGQWNINIITSAVDHLSPEYKKSFQRLWALGQPVQRVPHAWSLDVANVRWPS
jgi:hypothetical protein